MEYEFALQPRPYQLDAFNASKDLQNYGIFWEPGCGKSKITIDTACYLYEKKEIDAVLVVAPNGVHVNWLTDEIPKHTPERLRPHTHSAYWNSAESEKKKKEKIWQTVNHEGLSWLLMSYDGLMTELGKKSVWEFLKKRKVLYVVDEGHHIKTPSTARTKRIVASGKYAKYRRLLTGTPIANTPFDIFSQVQFIADSFWASKGINGYTVFKSMFANTMLGERYDSATGSTRTYPIITGYKNLELLQSLLKEIGHRITKEEANLGLPEKLYVKKYFTMSKEQARMYAEMEEHMVTSLEGTVSFDFSEDFDDTTIIDVDLPIVRNLRLQQIACGYVPTPDIKDQPVTLINKKNPRLQALKEITDELHQPTIIWARFTKDIDQIMEMLGKEAVRYDGTISDAQCLQNRLDFQNGKVKYFVGNQQKGKEGITLVIAKNVIYYSNSYNLVHRIQSEDRAHRIGQTDVVTYYDIIAENTIDLDFITCFRDKKDLSNICLGDKTKEWI